VTEVDPDPRDPEDAQSESVLGNREMPTDGDPTQGGKRGEMGDSPSVESDEPADGQGYPVGGGSVTEEADSPPVADSGPGA
jgi:hypothetical protein